jgi:hypothetical protein
MKICTQREDDSLEPGTIFRALTHTASLKLGKSVQIKITHEEAVWNEQ